MTVALALTSRRLEGTFFPNVAIVRHDFPRTGGVRLQPGESHTVRRPTAAMVSNFVLAPSTVVVDVIRAGFIGRPVQSC